MQIVRCDGCGRVLDPKTDTYYSVSDLSKHRPRLGYRMIFEDKDRALKAEDVGWVDYKDIDLCDSCVLKPFDITPHLRDPRQEQ